MQCCACEGFFPRMSQSERRRRKEEREDLTLHGQSNSPLQVTEHNGGGAAANLRRASRGCNMDKKLVKVWPYLILRNAPDKAQCARLAYSFAESSSAE
jgi:hypothetical protein